MATLRDRVVLAVDIPATQHRALIGRGGQHLNDLQTRTGAQVQFPGSRSYGQVGEAENIEEFKDTAEGNIVKVTGPRAACEKAIEELKVIDILKQLFSRSADHLSLVIGFHQVVS